MKKLNIIFILGTGRKDRQSEHVARFVMKEASKRNMKPEHAKAYQPHVAKLLDDVA